MKRTHWGPAFGVVLALAGLTWLVAGAGMTFFSDEWAFIEFRSLADPADWFRPHNEHWSTLPIILYRLMVETIGIGSYMPYLAVVVGLHLGVAAMVFRLVERRSGGPWAFLAGTLVAFLGAGFENVFWGFQTGFVASVLFGLIALDVTDREPTPRLAAGVALLLLLSLMASGTGIVMCAAVGVEWLLSKRWRRHLPWLGAPAVAYLAWYLTFGRGGITTMRDPFTLEAVADMPAFVIGGFGNAGGAIAGVGSTLGIVIAVLVAAWALLRAWRRTLATRVVGLFAAITLQYALIGLVRGDLFAGQVAYTRYTYVSGILLLLAVSALAGHPTMPRTAALRPFAIAGVLSLVILAFGYNAALLAGGRELFLGRADMTRALLTAGLRSPLPSTTDPDRSLVLVPAPTSLEHITRTFGDARTDHLVPGSVQAIPPVVQQEADRRVREGAPVPLPER